METIRAIVLHTTNYKESSKILHLYTTSGVKSAMAHGVKKLNNTNRYLAQTTNIISFQSRNKSMYTLQEGHLIEEFENVKVDPLASAFAHHILELVWRVVDNQNNHETIFDFLIRVLRYMNQGFDAEILSFIVELKLLYAIGYGLQFNTCIDCQKTTDLQFSPYDGGMICNTHQTINYPYYNKTISAYIKQLYRIAIDDEELPDIQPSDRMLIRKAIDEMYMEYTGCKTKSRKIIKQFTKY